MQFNQTNNNAGDVNNAMSDVCLTAAEKSILAHVVTVFNAYLSLPNRGADDDQEVCDGVHRIQNVFAMRVARRADPDIWIIH